MNSTTTKLNKNMREQIKSMECKTLVLSLVFHGFILFALINTSKNQSSTKMQFTSNELAIEIIDAPVSKVQFANKTKSKISKVNKAIKKSKPRIKKSADSNSPTFITDKVKATNQSLGSNSNKSIASGLTTKSFDSSIINNSLPRYPSLAIRKGWQGQVLISILVDAFGNTQKVTILKPSEFKLLDNSALKTAKNWKFKPDPNGKPFKVTKNIIFKLK